MTRDIGRLSNEDFDLLVLGGGLHGLAAAYEGALRGLRVALVERNDFGSGTSFHHARSLQGGFRGAAAGQPARARDAIRECRAFARIAPQLLSPSAWVLPTATAPWRARLRVSATALLETLLGVGTGPELPESHQLPPARFLPRSELIARAPGASAAGWTGAALWHEYTIDHGERLALAFALAAFRHGAVLVNYADAVEPLRDGRTISGMRVRDSPSGALCDVHARLTINAAGAGVGRIIAAFGTRELFPLVKVVSLVLHRPAEPPALVVADGRGRWVTALPWRERLVVSTPPSTELCGPDDTALSAAELDATLAEANAAFPWLALQRDDVAFVNRAVLPARMHPGRIPRLLEDGIVRDHRAEGIEGALSIVAAGHTTARLLAERAVSLAARRLEVPVARSRSGELPLISPLGPAGDGSSRRAAPSAPERISRLYGATAARVLGLHAEHPELALPLAAGLPVTGAQVVEAVRHEMALTLEDVVLRRIGIGAAGYPGDEVVAACARVMQAELRWPAERVDEEVAALRRFYQSLSPGSDDRRHNHNRPQSDSTVP